MMDTILKTAIEHWPYIAPLVKRPETEQEYNALVDHLDTLLDIVDDEEQIAAWFALVVLPRSGSADDFIPSRLGDRVGGCGRLTGRNDQKFTGANLGDESTAADGPH
jgi:hypothetical protein